MNHLGSTQRVWKAAVVVYFLVCFCSFLFFLSFFLSFSLFLSFFLSLFPSFFHFFFFFWEGGWRGGVGWGFKFITGLNVFLTLSTLFYQLLN